MHICVRAKVAESFIPIVLCCWVIWGAQNQHKMLCVFALQWIPFFGVNSGEGVSHCLSLLCRWKLFQNFLLNLLILFCFFTYVLCCALDATSLCSSHERHPHKYNPRLSSQNPLSLLLTHRHLNVSTINNKQRHEDHNNDKKLPLIVFHVKFARALL